MSGRTPSAPAHSLGKRLTRFSLVDFVLGVVAVFGLIALAGPTIVAIIGAFGRDRYSTFPPSEWTLHWFATIDPVYWQVAGTSLTLATLTTVGSIVLGVPAALALARWRGRGRAAIGTLVRSPLQIPYVVFGVAALQFYLVLDRTLGIEILGTMTGLVLAHVVIATPYMIGAVVPTATGLKENVELAAYGLGASRTRTFFTITIPGLKNAIVAGALFSFLISFDDVPVSLFLMGAGTQTLPVKLYFDTQFSLSPSLYAVAAVITVFTTAAVAILMRVVGLKRLSGR